VGGLSPKLKENKQHIVLGKNKLVFKGIRSLGRRGFKKNGILHMPDIYWNLTLRFAIGVVISLGKREAKTVLFLKAFHCNSMVRGGKGRKIKS
jgi:hypothetical protein